MANENIRPRPVEVVGNHWIHRDAGDGDAKFYRRDEADVVFADLETMLALAEQRADQLQERLDRVELKAAQR